jgi:hypothetical protein
MKFYIQAKRPSTCRTALTEMLITDHLLKRFVHLQITILEVSLPCSKNPWTGLCPETRIQSTTLPLIFSSTPRFAKWCLSVRFSKPNLVDFSFYHAWYMPRPSHLPSSNHIINMWWRVSSMKFLIKHCHVYDYRRGLDCWLDLLITCRS